MAKEWSAKHRGWYWLVALGAIGLDQLTKIWVLQDVGFQERINIIPNFFDITHVYNPGAAFSFLADAGGWQKYVFIVFALAVTIYLGQAMMRGQLSRLGSWAAMMIVGGALGNVIDRLAYGHVVDFLLFYWQNHYYPAFNVADSFICVGAALLVWDGLKKAPQKEAEK